jgi:hypothetical protein
MAENKMLVVEDEMVDHLYDQVFQGLLGRLPCHSTPQLDK